MSWEQVLPFMHQETCADFFESLDSSFCVNEDVGARLSRGPTWCYVSPGCKRLNGGSSGEGSTWKVCGPGDPALGDLSPTELLKLATHDELNFGTLMKAAYTAKADVWRDLEEIWWFGDSDRKKDAATVSVYEVQADGYGDKVIEHGDTLWGVNVDKGSRTGYTLACMAGCEVPAAVPQTFPDPAVERSCECQNWKDLYASGRAQCGEAHELAFPTRMSGLSVQQVLPFVQLDFCTNFFEKLDNNVCVPIDAGLEISARWFGKSWCFVSPECSDLNGGGRAPSGLNWKACSNTQELVQTMPVDPFADLFVVGFASDARGRYEWQDAVQWLREAQLVAHPGLPRFFLRGAPRRSLLPANVRQMDNANLLHGVEWLKQARGSSYATLALSVAKSFHSLRGRSVQNLPFRTQGDFTPSDEAVSSPHVRAGASKDDDLVDFPPNLGFPVAESSLAPLSSLVAGAAASYVNDLAVVPILLLVFIVVLSLARISGRLLLSCRQRQGLLFGFGLQSVSRSKACQTVSTPTPRRIVVARAVATTGATRDFSAPLSTDPFRPSTMLGVQTMVDERRRPYRTP